MERNQLRDQARTTINNQVSTVNRQIDEQNERAVSQIAGFLSQNFSVPSSKLYELKNLLRSYLRYSEDSLIDFLTNIKLENIKQIVKNLESQYPAQRKTNVLDFPCTYVPSAFCSPTSSRLIYGGVLLQARPVLDERVSQRGQGGQEETLKSHGNAFRIAKAQFMKLSMEDPKVPSHIRGHLRNEIRRTNGDWYQVRNPPGYDVDHTRDAVNYCRWKFIESNRSTSPEAERIKTRAQPAAFKIDERVREIMQKRKSDYIKMGLCYKGKKMTKMFIYLTANKRVLRRDFLHRK